MNGLLSLAYGYRLKHFSVEAGIADIFDNNYFQVDHPVKDALIYLSNSYSVWTIPLTMKYDFDLDQQGTFRIGGLFSTNFILNSSSDKQLTEEFEGNFNTGSQQISYKGLMRTNNHNLTRKLFFKSGIYIEALLGKSNFLILEVSRNFGSPVLSSFDVEYSINNGNFINKTINSSVNGTIVGIGLRKPLNTLMVKKRLLRT